MTSPTAPAWPRGHRIRWVHKLLAQLGGYFWLPCPLCGRQFAGHEVGSRAVYETDVIGAGKGICPACEAAGLGHPYDPRTTLPMPGER